MDTFDFKKRNLTSGPQLLGSLLIIAGLVALSSPYFLTFEQDMDRVLWVGSGAIILGFIIATTYDGTLIDFAEKKYKAYSSIAGFKIGEWRPLPDVSTLKVTSSSYIRMNTPNGVSPTMSQKVNDFNVLLYANEPKPTFSFVYSNKDKAIKHATYLASRFNVNLVLNVPE